MVALLNKIDKEITSQKKRGITFIRKEILDTDMSLYCKHEWKYRLRFGKIRAHKTHDSM